VGTGTGFMAGGGIAGPLAALRCTGIADRALVRAHSQVPEECAHAGILGRDLEGAARRPRPQPKANTARRSSIPREHRNKARVAHRSVIRLDLSLSSGNNSESGAEVPMLRHVSGHGKSSRAARRNEEIMNRKRAPWRDAHE